MRLRLIVLCAFMALNTFFSAADSPGPPRPPIRADLGMYTPGMVPFGIGEPVKEARILADEWQKTHPGCSIKFLTVPQTGTTEGEWLKTQLLGGIAPEIVSMNTEVAWQAIDKDWFIPLDEYLQKPNPYMPGNEHWIDMFENQALFNSKRAPNGKLYCITYDTVETGLYCNMTLLRSLGITQLPTTWKEMLDTFKVIQSKNITPMTAPSNLASDWGEDIIFEMLYHDLMPTLDPVDSPPDVKAYQEHFLDPQEGGFLFTKGFFSSRDPRWREVNRLVKEWRGYWAKEQKFSDPNYLFLTGRLAMLWDGSWTIRRLARDPYINFDWTVTYIPTITKETSQYASGTPATLIGGAATQIHITNSARIHTNLDERVDFLMWLSVPQNIERIANEALIFMPSVKGAKTDPRLQPFTEIFRRKSCAIQWMEAMDPEYKKEWRRWLDYYLNDGFGMDEYLKVLDANFAAWVKSHEKDAAWDFTAMESVWQTRKEVLLRELDPAP